MAYIIASQMLLSAMPTTVFAVDSKLIAASKAINWLKQNQNSNGSWGTLLNIMETSEVIACIAEDDFSNTDVQDRAISWLKSQNHRNNDELFRQLSVPALQAERGVENILNRQNPDGGWSIYWGYESDVLDTLLALDALMSGSLTKLDEARNGILYLVNTQNPNGGWSYVKEGESNEYLTAHAITILDKFKTSSGTTINSIEAALLRARPFLLSRIDGGSWGLNENNIKHTLFACEAIKNTNPDVFETAVEKVISVLQPNGSLFHSPSLTARLVYLLQLPDGPPAFL